MVYCKKKKKPQTLAHYIPEAKRVASNTCAVRGGYLVVMAVSPKLPATIVACITALPSQQMPGTEIHEGPAIVTAQQKVCGEEILPSPL